MPPPPPSPGPSTRRTSTSSNFNFALTVTSRLTRSAFSLFLGACFLGILLVWDAALTCINFALPGVSTKKGKGRARWPEYEAPKEGDSRCSCPALNTMANHGILPRSGRNITFRELTKAVGKTFNFAPTSCLLVPFMIAGILDRDYWTDKFDLGDIDVHNGMEHDASLTRIDSYHERDQSKISVPLVEELLRSGTGPEGFLTTADLSRISTRRRAEAKRTNPQFSLSFAHKMFGSSDCATLLMAFGGDVSLLKTWLLEERLPEGWMPKDESRMGCTILTFNRTVLEIEFGIPESGGSFGKSREL